MKHHDRNDQRALVRAKSGASGKQECTGVCATRECKPLRESRMAWRVSLTRLQMVTVPSPQKRTSAKSTQLQNKRRGKDRSPNAPERIASTDSQPKRGADVEPEAFPELAGDRGDGHIFSGV